MSFNLAMQKVMIIRGYDADDKMVLSLKGLKESTFTNGKESTYVTRDNVNVASFDFGSMASISGSSAFIQSDLLAAQLGADEETLTNTTEVRKVETVVVGATNTALTKFTATGDADEEIGYAYVLDSDIVLTQAAVAGAGTFSYASGTKTLTFHTDITEGTKIEVAYFPTASTATKVSHVTTNFTKTLRLEAEILFKDVCNDELVLGYLVAEKGKITGEFEWNLTEGGDPAVHNFSATFLETCDANKLFELIVYDEEDMV